MRSITYIILIFLNGWFVIVERLYPHLFAGVMGLLVSRFFGFIGSWGSILAGVLMGVIFIPFLFERIGVLNGYALHACVNEPFFSRRTWKAVTNVKKNTLLSDN